VFSGFASLALRQPHVDAGIEAARHALGPPNLAEGTAVARQPTVVIGCA